MAFGSYFEFVVEVHGIYDVAIEKGWPTDNDFHGLLVEPLVTVGRWKLMCFNIVFLGNGCRIYEGDITVENNRYGRESEAAEREGANVKF